MNYPITDNILYYAIYIGCSGTACHRVLLYKLVYFYDFYHFLNLFVTEKH